MITPRARKETSLQRCLFGKVGTQTAKGHSMTETGAMPGVPRCPQVLEAVKKGHFP